METRGPGRGAGSRHTRRGGHGGGPHGRPAKNRVLSDRWRAGRPRGRKRQRPPRGCELQDGRGEDRGKTRPAARPQRGSRSGRRHRRQERNRRARSRRRRGPPRPPAPRGRASRGESQRKPPRRRGGTEKKSWMLRRQKPCFARLGAQGCGAAGMSRAGHGRYGGPLTPL